MASQFWVRVAGRVHGPFTPGQLKQFAAARRLTADDYISSDEVRWISADKVPGLTLRRRRTDSTREELELADTNDDRATPHPDYESLTLDDLLAEESTVEDAPIQALLADDDYRLSQLLDEPVEEQTPEERAADMMPEFLAPLAITIDDSRRGVLYAFLASVLLVLLGIAGGTLLARLLPGYTEIIALGAIVFVAVDVVGLFSLGVCGSQTTIELVRLKGESHARIASKLLFVPIADVATPITKNDLLVKVPVSPFAPSLFSNIDLIMLALVIACCAVGAFPGLLFWFWWWRSRGEATESQVVRLALRTKFHPRPIVLIEKRCAFNATRFGDEEIAGIVDAFRRFAPGIDLHQETLN